MHGSCRCGAIAYRVNGALLNVVNCHCHFCRSHTGAAFATYAVIKHSALEIEQKEQTLAIFAEGEAHKHFCARCGTPIFNLNPRYPGACMLYFGTLADAATLAPKANVWCESQLAWLDRMGELPAFPQGYERPRREG